MLVVSAPRRRGVTQADDKKRAHFAPAHLHLSLTLTLTFAELCRTTRFVETIVFAFHNAAVAGQEARRL